MCRYAFKTYKPKLACFTCRKAFRRRLKAEVDPGGEEHIAKCPQCAQPMADLGPLKTPGASTADAPRPRASRFAQTVQRHPSRYWTLYAT